MRAPSAIRIAAWALVAAGVSAPLVRRRLGLSAPVVLGTAAATPAVVSILLPPGTRRQVAVSALNMYAYIASYKMPFDDPRLEARVRVDYPIAIDRVLGLGKLPTERLQAAFSAPGTVNRFERALAFCHWMWFAAPHVSLIYVLLRDPERFPSAAARMYAVFDIGAVAYWALPTAPPWWAAAHGHLRDGQALEVRRMMIEYGPDFWGPLWGPAYELLKGNPLAAMPSLHFASSLMGAHVLSEVDPIAGAAGWIYAAMLGLALVYLGEHYVIDLIAGTALTESVRLSAPRLEPVARRVADLMARIQARLADRERAAPRHPVTERLLALAPIRRTAL